MTPKIPSPPRAKKVSNRIKHKSETQVSMNTLISRIKTISTRQLKRFRAQHLISIGMLVCGEDIINY
jgi:hypothetical protein